MYFLTKELYFPPVDEASYEGILAVGGDLATERLLLAYKNGIFPWFSDDEPILWWSPPYRMVVYPLTYKAPKSLRNIINRNTFEVTINKDFEAVIRNCQQIDRKNQELVGGLYGIDLGHVFCGESMFSKVSNASKVAFVKLIEYLREKNYLLLDCQLHNDHLEKLGAFEISRETFMLILKSDNRNLNQ